MSSPENNSEKEVAAVRIEILDEAATLSLGDVIFSVLNSMCLDDRVTSIFMRGDLGMGKTTMTRGILMGAGYEGRVKSPTYTIVEPYELDDIEINHFDLYRLGEPEELEFMGIRDYFDIPKGACQKRLCIFEWPDKRQGFLPKPDMEIALTYFGGGRLCEMFAEKSLLETMQVRCIERGFNADVISF